MTQRKTPRTDPTIAVAYLRASTDEQRLGPEAQRAAIEAWSARESVRIAAWFTDQGVSGGAELGERPALLEALAAVRSNAAGALVVAKRDRLARDVAVAALVEREVRLAGARIVSADGAGDAPGPEGEMLRGIVDVFAQYERAVIRARTKAALAAKRARGERLGRPRFGFAVDATGAVVEKGDEQAVRSAARALRAEGRSLRAVVVALEAQGHRQRSGKAFALTQVARMVAS